MDADSDKLVITLMVGRQNYTVQVLREQEEDFRRAARAINDALGRYERKYPQQSYERYASAVMLDFAVQAIRQQRRKDTSPYAETINRLAAEVADLLENGGADIPGGGHGTEKEEKNRKTNNKL